MNISIENCRTSMSTKWNTNFLHLSWTNVVSANNKNFRIFIQVLLKRERQKKQLVFTKLSDSRAILNVSEETQNCRTH